MKFLVSPFFGYLLLQVTGSWSLQRYVTGRKRAVLNVLLCSTLMLMIASTSIVGRALEASLTLTPMAPSTTPPVFIVVLGGGYVAGGTRDEDVLVSENQRRVVHGVMLWRRFPSARMVFSGAAPGYEGIRGTDRMVQLMAEVALNMGVAASAVMLEPRSRNTREHPIEALKLRGVRPAKPIAIVTSSVHMRRARREFSRYFQEVQVDPVSAVTRPLRWRDFIPEPGILGSNTAMVQEWVGMLWYALLATKNPAMTTARAGESERHRQVGSRRT